MYRRQAEADGASLAQWVRAALDQAAAVPASVTTSEPDRQPDEPDPIARPAAERIAALRLQHPGLRPASELRSRQAAKPEPLSRADKQAITASTAERYRAGAEPEAIVAQLLARYPAHETYIRRTVERMDGAA